MVGITSGESAKEQDFVARWKEFDKSKEEALVSVRDRVNSQSNCPSVMNGFEK